MKIRELLERRYPRGSYSKFDQTAYDFSKNSELGDSNIMVQLIKNIDRHGGKPIVFQDGSEIELSSQLSHKIVMKLSDMMPREKHEAVKRIAKSPEELKRFLHSI